MTSKSVCYGLLLLPVIFGVDTDYLAPVLRSQSLNCQSIFHQAYCHVKCGEKKGLCVKDKCFCLSAEAAKAYSSRAALKRQNNNEYEIDDDAIDFVDSGEAEVEDETRIDTVPIYALRPTVRHHIAHFCPNLDVARECIKKCMAQGKPAFCGKDHVCYCGHKYSNNDNNSNVDIKGMYAQFHDLYTKYFGTDENSDEHQETQN